MITHLYDVDSASDCLDDFDLRWEEKFGPDSTAVMSLTEFDSL